MDKTERFTEAELQIAKSVDLTEVASSLGYTVKRIGRYYTLKEMDSIRIYNRSHWFRWSRQYDKGENGGSQIDFLRVFAGMDVKDALFWLLDFANYHKPVERLSEIEQTQAKNNPRLPFVLPEPAGNNVYLYEYLQKERGISKAVIDTLIDRNLIYESNPYHNIVFKGNDKDGITRFASMRGVFDREGRKFKCDVAGNDKNYGFNIVHEESNRVLVFEGAIDLMSYLDVNGEHDNMLALGMLADLPLHTFLEEHPQIEIIGFCLDNDEPGRKAKRDLCTKYYEQGYEIEDLLLPMEYKDYNDYLKQLRTEERANMVESRSKVQMKL